MFEQGLFQKKMNKEENVKTFCNYTRKFEQNE